MELWQRLTTRAKIGMGISLVCILALAVGLGLWAYRTEYSVLFADLSNGDASSMVGELERLKVPYQLTDGGKTILVPQDLVYKTRLKVMGKELPLHGAVGFEVFNNADFGMTEFVQKVNYQRAVQGELTRTILSIDDVQSARVHLAIPEQGLFKKALSKPKASVTLVMKPGRVLAGEQITGIQRLVAASVPEIVVNDVTILDQHGVSLTRNTNAEQGFESAQGAQNQLDSKRSMEEYLLKKVGGVLDNMFGAGTAIASVDVVLNLDQNKITTEDVIPAKAAHSEGVPTGVVVRERQTNQNGTTTAAGAGLAASARDANGNNSVEADYQVGRRVEQLAVAPGATKRMTVAVVVKKNLDAAQLAQLKEVVSLTLGLNPARGDAIVIQSLEQLISSANQSKSEVVLKPATSLASTSGSDGMMTSADVAARAGKPNRPEWSGVAIVVLIGVFLLIPLWWLFRASAATPAAAAPAMSEQERERLLQDVKQWIMQGAPDDVAGGAK